MAKRKLILSFLGRALAGLILVALVLAMDTSWLEHAWTEVVAATCEQAYVHPERHELGIKAVLYLHVPDTGYFTRAVRFGPRCTFVHVVAAMVPFLIRRRRWKPVCEGTAIALLIAFVVNYIRIRLGIALLLGLGLPWFWAHDVPGYMCVTGCIAGAVWWWRRTLRNEYRATSAHESPAAHGGIAEGLE